MNLFKRKYNVDYSTLITELEKGDAGAIQHLRWQPKRKSVTYLPVTTELIQKLKKEGNSTLGLTIYKKVQKGRFELIVFELPWTEDDVPYLPIIIDRSNSKIIGIMMPFNELYGHLTTKENKMISSLGMEWTAFVIKYRYNL